MRSRLPLINRLSKFLCAPSAGMWVGCDFQKVANEMLKYLIIILLLFVAGCDALMHSPDTWLDPDRWEQKEALKGGE